MAGKKKEITPTYRIAKDEEFYDPAFLVPDPVRLKFSGSTIVSTKPDYVYAWLWSLGIKTIQRVQVTSRTIGSRWVYFFALIPKAEFLELRKRLEG